MKSELRETQFILNLLEEGGWKKVSGRIVMSERHGKQSFKLALMLMHNETQETLALNSQEFREHTLAKASVRGEPRARYEAKGSDLPEALLLVLAQTAVGEKVQNLDVSRAYQSRTKAEDGAKGVYYDTES